MRPKKCKQCGEMFTPDRSFQSTCCPEHAILYARAKNERKREQQARKDKADLKKADKSHLMKVAQSTVNKYVRLRDQDKPCISCGTTNAKWDAGHYQSRGKKPQLRFCTWNNHKQCFRCNRMLSGNLEPYRVNLIKKIGLEKVEFLEQNQETKKFTVEYLQRLIAIFKKKIKRIENAR